MTILCLVISPSAWRRVAKCFQSREAALEALATNSFSAILLNIISGIPGGGFKFIEELDRCRSPIPIIIVTAAVRKNEFGDAVLNPSNIGWSPSVFAIVAMPATLETMVKVLNAVINRGVQPPSNGAVP
jgi:hypothetical protein